MKADSPGPLDDALVALRSGTGSLEETQVDGFLESARAEPNTKLARAAIAELIDSPRLGLDQLERIARSDRKLVRGNEDRIRRTYLNRRLAEGVTDPLFEQVIESRDATVQTKLVRDPRLSRKQAEQLAKRGSNPTIRQNAQAWFQDKKAWK